MTPHFLQSRSRSATVKLQCKTDCENILSDLKHQEKQLKLKRRLLMGLPTSNSKREKSKAPKFLKYKYLPESLLREDDIFYETVKTHVEVAFGACNFEKGNHVIQDTVEAFDTPNIRVLISCLDALTNNGLYLIAMILTGGSTKFDKTRYKMKKIIRETLSKYFRGWNHDLGHKEIITRICQVFKDMQNFREKSLKFIMAYQSKHAVVKKLLSELDDLPSQALVAMHRKLRCVQSLPVLGSQKMNRSRKFLINQVRKKGERMLIELGNDDELQEPLAKALAVADLSRRLITGYDNSALTGCHQFSPEIRHLQNEIVKAIWLVETKVKFQELETLKLLLDPDADVSNGALRNAIKKVLIEYLFECGDMNTIPESLLEALSIINKNSQTVPHGCFLKDKIEEETERILSLSANVKQAVWDLLPDREFDAEFADVYMEELEESDDDDDDGLDDDYFNASILHSDDSDSHAESIGEVVPVNSAGPFSSSTEVLMHDSADTIKPKYFARAKSRGGIRRLLTMDSPNGVPNECSILTMDSSNGVPNERSMEVDEVKPSIGEHFAAKSVSSKFLSEDMSSMAYKDDSLINKYLSVQDVCDEGSMIAYNLIGHFLQKFSQEQNVNLNRGDILYLRGYSSPGRDMQGTQDKPSSEENLDDPLTMQAIEELIPSLPNSGLERLKEMIGHTTKGFADDSSEVEEK